MIWEGCRTHRVVTGPMNFKKSGFFFGKSCSRIFGAPGCHPSTLIDFANNALVSKDFRGAQKHDFRGIQNPWSCHWSDEFQKKDVFFFRKIMLPGFWGPGCHACNLIDLINTAMASRASAKNICMISEGYKAHRGVTSPMNLKKNRTFFRKLVLPGFWCTWLPSKHFN